MVTGRPGLKKSVYHFSEGDASMTALLGGKGSNLCEMFRLGFPVPPWLCDLNRNLPGIF